jgi:hypothetical protein
MTRLHRTALRLSEKIECAVKALANHEEHGVITDLSCEFDLSRPTVYEVKETACEVLKAHFYTPACKRFFPSIPPMLSAWLVSSFTGSALCERAPGSLGRLMSGPAPCLALSLVSKTGWVTKPPNC